MTDGSGSMRGLQVAVTGASGNMGRALCAALLAEGARVWAIDRAAAHIAELMSQLGAGLRGEPCDLRVEEAIERNLDAAGPIWGLAHTVGGFRPGSVSTSSAADLDAMVDLNLRTTFLVTRAAMRRMLAGAGGRIVTVGSITAALGTGLSGAALYNATKSAVIALTRAADEEGRSHNVRACCLAPNTLDTPQNRAAMPDADPARWVSLDQVAAAAVAALRPSSGLGGAVLTLPGTL